MQELAKQIVHGNVEVRREAVESMRGIMRDECVPLLLKAMADASWRVRKASVDVLFDDYPVESYIDGLIQLLYVEDNPGPRNAAIEALIRLGRQAVPFLISAFDTPNKDVRKFIIDVLGEQRDSRSLPLMLEAIRDEDENVRASAVEHLGKVRELSVVDALIEILDRGDLWTAYPAADALGRIGNRKAIPHLLDALQKKPLREPVLKALGCFADESTLGHIIPLLADSSRNIQEQALRAVEKFHRRGVNADVITGEIRRTFGDRAMDTLIAHAWSNKRKVRISAILVLGLMRDERAYSPLLDISQEEEFAEDVKRAFVYIGSDKPESLLPLFDTANSYQLRFICEVTGSIVSPVYYDVLERMLSHYDGHVRSSSALSISKLKDARAVNRLMTLLADEYEDVQDAGVEALANLREFLGMEEMRITLSDENPKLRRNIVRLLGKMGLPESVDELGFALKDENPRVRSAAIEALSMIGTDEAEKFLSHALTDEDPDIRIAAVLSLGAIGGAGVADSIVILTADPDESVRVAAAKALGMQKRKSVVPSLTSLLADTNGFVVTAAIESLGAIGGDDARRAVLPMLSSEDEEIKRTAILTLSLFEDTESELMPFLHHPEWATRIAAVKALGRRAEGKVRQELEKLLDTEEDPTVIKTIEETLCV